MPNQADSPPLQPPRTPEEDLLSLVYPELRRLAQNRVSTESSEQSLTATALVHEAFLRLAKNGDAPVWEDRKYLFSAAAEAMRRILIERARARNRIKRGENPQRMELTDSMVIAPDADHVILAVNDALEELVRIDPKAAEIVKLRYFGGFTLREIAETSGVSYRTTKRHWAYARAWLRTALRDDFEVS